uniref:Predicted protein n=1 Tax=Hordeum vulgare subsp. vulgare TaxID=112509 RepID=F2E4U5_HORVV|nr:predicted protein [Hordeum vulgare subsp. vulgare]
MSHYNLISATNPEKICEENQKKIANRRLYMNNHVRYSFDSADYYKQADLAQKDKEKEASVQYLSNPPVVKKKIPVLKQGHSSGKKIFDSADYFLEIYGKTPVN